MLCETKYLADISITLIDIDPSYFRMTVKNIYFTLNI